MERCHDSAESFNVKSILPVHTKNHKLDKFVFMNICTASWKFSYLFVYTDGLFVVNYNSMPTTHLLGEPTQKLHFKQASKIPQKRLTRSLSSQSVASHRKNSGLVCLLTVNSNSFNTWNNWIEQDV